MKKIELSLILPCYNEEQHFIKSASTILSFLKAQHIPFEIIFVEDKSIDTTKQLIQSFIKQHPEDPLRVLFHKYNQGRGAAVMDGIRAAHGTIVGFIDIDLEIDCRYIPQFFTAAKREFDGACAVRTYIFSFRTLPRFVASVAYKHISRFFLRIPFHDTEAGYKFFHKKKLLPILPLIKSVGWFWDTEIMALGWKKGLHIKEIPVLFIRRADKTSTVRLLPDIITYGTNLYRFKKRFLTI